MEDLKELKNLSTTIVANLNKIGIYSVSQLRKKGPVKTYKEITSKYPNRTWSVCYYLYSLEGALTDKHWNDIGAKKKKELLQAVGKTKV